MAEYIREVERIIDEYHKSHSVFLLNRKTALFNALTVFEDCCRLGGRKKLQRTGDSLGYSILIRDQLDALNVLIQWIFQDCAHENNDDLDMDIIPERYVATADLLLHQATAYSPICSAYISYSRGHFTAKINEIQKKITFSDVPDNRRIVISDMMETILRDQASVHQMSPIRELPLAHSKLISSIYFQDDEHISYSLDNEVWVPFQNMMEQHWELTSELPEEWEFDSFSIKDFKYFWVAIATFSIIHMTACLESGVPGANEKEAVIVRSDIQFVELVADKTGVSVERITAILKLLTYNNKLRNNDIVYQPFVELGNNQLALAPHLILSSRPERNLISLIHKLKDKSYFDLTNLREGIMQEELDSIVEKLKDVLVSKNKSLPGTLPDVDYAIWDQTSNSILVCELKWLIEPDSTPEVLARIQDLEHGCEQISKILTYARDNVLEFCNKVFGISVLEKVPEIVGCVVSKKGIRVDNSDVPVISSPTLKHLLQHNSVIKTIEEIKNRSFLIPAQQNFQFGLQAINYAGYTFEIPALIKEEPNIHGTYKRAGSKIGRNSPCPCGSGKKYKKCCGR